MRPDGFLRAIIRSPKSPSREQMGRFWSFLDRRYEQDIELRWVEDYSVIGGFILEVGDDSYDWSLEGRLRQLQKKLDAVESREDTGIVSLLQEQVKEWAPNAEPEEIGFVDFVGDGVARVISLETATYDEIVIFECGLKGMVQGIQRDHIDCIIFGDDEQILQGSKVYRTFRQAGIPVGENFLGRVVNSLGEPIDGKGTIREDGFLPIETPAPGIIDRQGVNKPMETGLLSIDSMFPIGRGQRELIIGDRQTGKTTIALDTIINQKGKDVICIYVAIGQKNSSVAQIVGSLQARGALSYTVVVNASASDSVPLQYIAPYSGTTMGEYFMRQGKDVLIVYDDLSKHAVAYRTMSLLLGRSPGREAYPGDVFYLHSRLLERSAHLSDELGGGSMTALPIVETQAGDVSAYIPTNIISITDGQIFLESNLFFEGQRPAVNVGLSVSRVGRAAQTSAMKKAAGSIKLALSQYREMEVFTQFSSDLDEGTKKQLQFGQSLMGLLRQSQHHPYSQHQQVILLIAGLNECFAGIPLKKVRYAAEELLSHMEMTQPKLCASIDQNSDITKEEMNTIRKEAAEFFARRGN